MQDTGKLKLKTMNSDRSDNTSNTTEDTPEKVFKNRRENSLIVMVDTFHVYYADKIFDAAVDYQLTQVTVYRDKQTGKYYVRDEADSTKQEIQTVFDDESDNHFIVFDDESDAPERNLMKPERYNPLSTLHEEFNDPITFFFDFEEPERCN